MYFAMSCFFSVSVILSIRSSESGDVDFGGASGNTMSVNVREGAPAGAQVATIVAYTPGTGAVIRNYQEVPESDPGNYFDVQQYSGKTRKQNRTF